MAAEPRSPKEFGVKGYPTFIVANAETETINRWWGFDDSGDFMERLAGVHGRSDDDPRESGQRLEAEPNADRRGGVLGRIPPDPWRGPRSRRLYRDGDRARRTRRRPRVRPGDGPRGGTRRRAFHRRRASRRGGPSAAIRRICPRIRSVDVVEWVVDGLRKRTPQRKPRHTSLMRSWKRPRRGTTKGSRKRTSGCRFTRRYW